MPERAHLAHPAARLARVELDGEALTRLSPVLEADRAQAVADLAADNRFAPVAAPTAGPFVLVLSIQEGRLVFDVSGVDTRRIVAHHLALGPFRGLIKDYGM
jgi:uncharacterized protein (UPF0262 family)